jgi:hypothetical protein
MRFSSIVAGLDDDQLIVSYAVDKTMFAVNPPGPEAGEIAT